MPPDPVDPAAAALARARSAAGKSPARRRARPAQLSGPRPDSRDPKLLGGAIDQWARDNEYRDRMAVAGLLSRWSQIVGEQVAAHVSVVEHRPGSGGGTVVLRADSPAWALEVRYMADRLVQRIAEEIGPGLVSAIDVQGPSTRRAAGRLRVRHGRRSPRT